MIGIQQALEKYNADGIEVDVHMTADHRFVLYHDKQLDSKTDQSGHIEQQNWEEIKGAKYRAGMPFDWFQSEEVILLDSLMTYVKSLEHFPIIQLDLRTHCLCFAHEKKYERADVFMKQLIQQLNTFDIEKDKIQIITGYRELIELANALDSSFTILYEVGEFEDGLQWAIENDIKHMVVNRPILDAAGAKRAHEHGISITTFEAKSDQGHQQLILKNPDYIQSNHLPSLNRMLGIKN